MIFNLFFIALLGITCSVHAALPEGQAERERTFESEIFKACAITLDMQGDWITYLNNKLAQLNLRHVHSGVPYYNTDSTYLFERYPALYDKIPYINIAALPTPVEKLQNISKELGCEIYIKRDDLSGGLDCGDHPIYGGNKVRKLEFLLAQALALGADKVMTFGCVGSNHAVATAVHARRLALEPICMLKHQPPSRVVQENLLHHLHTRTELHYSASNESRKLLAIMIWLEHLKKDGKVPYIIPTGGSDVFGAIGFVNGVFELAEQIKRGLIPEPTHIYVACGSCATAAGIVLGCKVAGLRSQVVALLVEPDTQDACAQRIDQLFKETNNYLHARDHNFPLCSYTSADLRLNSDFTGTGYGVSSPEGEQAMHYMLERESITLEGTYTAKACAGMLAELKSHPVRALFWNTYCGLDFSDKLSRYDYHALPSCLHDYFHASHG